MMKNEIIKALYMEFPTLYSYYSIEDMKCEMLNIGDALIIKDDENIFSYHFIKDYYKIDFTKGYKTILINETIYNKVKNTIDNCGFNYKRIEYIKCLKYGIGNDLLEIDNLKNVTIYDSSMYSKLVYKGQYNEYEDYTLFDLTTKWYKLEMIQKEDINSYLDLKNKIKEITILGNKPSLLLHSCCGPCSSYVLEFLNKYFNITILYYNPNIYPEEEYNLRLYTQKKLIESMGLNIKVLEIPYNHNDYISNIVGLENLPEKSKRCYNCYRFRMELTAKMAKDNYDYFSTTISISPHKISKWLNEIGKELEKKYDVKYLYSDFKLENGYHESIKLSKKYNIYRQEYCGCEFSMPNKDKI